MLFLVLKIRMFCFCLQWSRPCLWARQKSQPSKYCCRYRFNKCENCLQKHSRFKILFAYYGIVNFYLWNTGLITQFPKSVLQFWSHPTPPLRFDGAEGAAHFRAQIIETKFWQIGVPTRVSFSSRVIKVCNLSQVEALYWNPKIVFSRSTITSPVRTRLNIIVRTQILNCEMTFFPQNASLFVLASKFYQNTNNDLS